MSNWILLLVGALVILYGMLHGVLMLISPPKHRRFNLRVNDPFSRLKWRPPESDSDHGPELGYRLAGLGIVIMCGLIAWGVFHSFFPGTSPLPQRPTTPTMAIGKNWWGFVSAAGCLLFGVYAFLSPFHVYQWSVRRLVSSTERRPEPNKIRRGIRFLAICFIIIGVTSIWLQLK